jgi:4-carboxymuconolactone decarboxylase
MRSRSSRLVHLTCAALLVTAVTPSGQGQATRLTVPPPPGGSRPARLKQPRIAPLAETSLTEVHRQVIAKYSAGGRPGNALMTLLTTPDLVDGTMPFQNYITSQSSLEPRHRELLILRTAWLLNNDYIWGEHAIAAKKAGFNAVDLRRVAEGTGGRGWDPFDATLLKLADELFRNSFISDATWKALAARYDMFHLLDAVMTVADFTTIGLLYNSFGVQPDPEFVDRIPLDVPYRIAVPPREPDLRVARVQPLSGTGLAIARTFANYPKMAEPRGSGADFVNRRSKLDPRFREILILRTGWDAQAEYEWAQHVGSVGRAREKGLDPLKIAQGPEAPGWDPFEKLLLQAADELYTDSMISDKTWAAMAVRFDSAMMMSATATATNYRMVSMALNALGVQIDPGDERFPASAKAPAR